MLAGERSLISGRVVLQMDSDDEMMAAMLLEEEDAIAAEEDENIAILSCLLRLQADEEANAAPKRGGSSFGRKKSKPRQRMEEIGRASCRERV